MATACPAASSTTPTGWWSQVFEAVRRRPDYAVFGPLLHAADDAADELEDAVFLLALLAEAGAAKPVSRVSCRPWPRWSLDRPRRNGRRRWCMRSHAEDRGTAEDADDFLVAIDRIAALEHAADDAERALTATAVRQAADFRQLHLYTAIGAKLEDATDALQHAGRMLRDHLLGGGAGWLTPRSLLHPAG